jgi:hypothetical protein
MKLPQITRASQTSGNPDRLPRRLTPRSRYPTVSLVPLYRSPLAKLAWIFGFGR